MWNIFKKKDKNNENEILIDLNIPVKLSFLILDVHYNEYHVEYEVKGLKNKNGSICVLAKRLQEAGTGIENFYDSKFITFDLSNLNKFTDIYYTNNKYSSDCELSYFSIPCGITTCVINQNDTEIFFIYSNMKKKLLKSIKNKVPSEVIKLIKSEK